MELEVRRHIGDGVLGSVAPGGQRGHATASRVAGRPRDEALEERRERRDRVGRLPR